MNRLIQKCLWRLAALLTGCLMLAGCSGVPSAPSSASAEAMAGAPLASVSASHLAGGDSSSTTTPGTGSCGGDSAGKGDADPGAAFGLGQTSREEQEEKLPQEAEAADRFAPYRAAAAAQLAKMTLEQKAGQLLLVRCPEQGAEEMIREVQPAGLVLFGRDFKGKNADEVRRRLAEYQAAAPIPLLLAVDEEGGQVCRISGNQGIRAEKFSSPRQVYASGGLDAVRSDGAEKATLLLDLGVNLNLAPVADLPDTADDYIYPRALGLDPGQTADFVTAAVEGMQGNGLTACLKHFPGYGPAADTHAGAAYDSRPIEDFRSGDFLPFQAGIQAGVRCVLISHNTVAAMDGERPASLSPTVHKILREELGFTGVILTDDLDMDAVRDYNGGESAVVLAVAAGNDLLTLSDGAAARDAILAAVKDGRLTQADLDRAAMQVLSLKYAMGILE